MRKNLYRKIIVFITALIPCASFSQSCVCTLSKERLYQYQELNMCGYTYDSSGMGKIITEFTLCYKDSVLVDNFHNEGASFLFRKMDNGFSLTSIDLEYSDGKFVYPETFYRVVYRLNCRKIKETGSYVKAAPLVLEMRRKFKELRKLY